MGHSCHDTESGKLGGGLLQCNFVYYKFGMEDWPGIKSGLLC